jgi:DNA-binding transcriptional LysR family regulator
MELRQLQHFVAVAEERHFTRAARRVNIVQSALSTSIRMLEEELRAQLFVRSTRQVRLTAAGQVLLDKARDALNAVTAAREAVAALQGLKRGTLRIGTVQSLPAFLDLPSLLAAFHVQHSAVEVRLCQGSATALLEKLRAGRLDLAFLPLCEPPEGIATTLIACDPMVLVCSQDHALVGRNAVRLAELGAESFVDFEADWGTRRLIDHAFLTANVERRSAFEVSDLDTLLELVAHGLGVGLVPESIAQTRRGALGIARLAEPEICWELVVAYLADGATDPAPRSFLDLLAAARAPRAAA